MADQISLLFRKAPATIGSVELDATLSENHMSGQDVTDHPIEEGSPITDHARKRPDSLTIDGLVTDTPVGLTQRQRAAQSSGTVDDADAPGYAQAAYLKLRELLTGKLFTIVTGLQVYDDMVLTDLTVPRDRTVGHALRFSATFKNVRIVKNKITVSIDAQRTKSARGKKKARLGGLAALKATADEAAKAVKNISPTLYNTLGVFVP